MTRLSLKEYLQKRDFMRTTEPTASRAKSRKRALSLRVKYGGGTMMIWDQGTYVPEGDPIKGLEKGKLTFRLNGKRLKGGFTLVRLPRPRSDDGKNWLLIKEHATSAPMAMTSPSAR
jgi:hypothetical protein